MATIRDRSDGGASIIHAFGHDHLSTSDERAHADQKDLAGFAGIDGQPSQSPHIPPQHGSPEIAVVGQNVEPCLAGRVDQGGRQKDGLTAVKTSKPVVFKADSARPGYIDAHHASSVTHQDHREMHGKCDLSKEGGLETITDLAEGKGIPPATKAVSLGFPIKAPNRTPPIVRMAAKSTEPVIMSKGEGSPQPGSQTAVVADLKQPRFSAEAAYIRR